MLPRSLHYAVGARVRERRKKPAAPVGMTTGGACIRRPKSWSSTKFSPLLLQGLSLWRRTYVGAKAPTPDGGRGPSIPLRINEPGLRLVLAALV